MDEVPPGHAAPPAMSDRAGDRAGLERAGLERVGPERVGEVLRAARERIALSLPEIANRTRVPLRHLEAIEANDYSGLPSPTYASGFVKAYARAVGADEVALARQAREEVDRTGRRAPDYVPYELPDPSRVPSRGLAMITLGLALAVILGVALWYGYGRFRDSASSASPTLVAVVPDAAGGVAPASTANATPVGGGQVTLTTSDRVWMRVYDADDKTLYLGTMSPGERFDVPTDAKNPMVNVGRPDKLVVTLNGSALPPLGAGDHAIKDVRISAAALQARQSGQPAAAASPQASQTPLANTAAGSISIPEARAPVSRPADRTAERSARRGRPALTETQRANLDAARNSPPPGPLASGNAR